MSARTTGGAVQFILFSSSFCGSCRRTRQILDTAARLVPEIEVIELNVADEPEIAEHEAIASTPTVILRDATGTQIFRSAGVPNLNQVLAVAARGLDSNER
ncbi:thioredoxin family protein [Actinomycetaceae bacterium L2_0104]